MVAIVRLSMDEKIFDEEAKATANDKKGKAKKPLQFAISTCTLLI